MLVFDQCLILLDEQSTSGEANVNKNKKNSDIPEKYFIVQNNEYLRAKYVLLYSEKANVKR